MQNEKNAFPFIAPLAGVIDSMTFTMEGAAISQGGPVSAPYMKIEFYRLNYNSVTSLGAVNVSLSASLTGINNTTSSGNQKQTVRVTALNLSVAQGDAIGVVFVPQGGNNSKINAILNLFGTMFFQFT